MGEEFNKVSITNENAQDCEKYLPFVLSTFGEDKKTTHLLDEKDLQNFAYCGEASKKKIHQNINTIMKSIDQNDHFLVNFTGHGNFDDSEFTFSLGYEDFAEKDFKEIFSSIKRKNAHTQIFIDSCFGGNALKNMGEIFSADDIWRGKLCGVSMANDQFMSFGSGEHSGFIFKEGHLDSTLQKFSCYLAKDKSNFSMTSLDYLINDWRLQKNRPEKIELSCKKDNALSRLDQEIEKIADGKTLFLRKQLLDQFKESILNNYQKCLPKDSQKKVEEELRLNNNLVTCYKYIASTKEEFKKLRYFLLENASEIDLMNTFLFDGKMTFADRKMLKHFDFIQNADIINLMKYKSLMCCLDYNFKTKKYPEFCY